MKKIPALIVIALGLAVMIFGGCKAPGRKPNRENFSFSLPKGKKYLYSISTHQRVGDSSIADMLWEYEIFNSSGKNFPQELTVTYKRVRIRMNFSGTIHESDTDIPFQDTTKDDINIDELMKTKYQALKGRTFKAKVDEMGKCVALDGVQPIIDAVVNSYKIPELMDKEMQSVKFAFNAATIERQMDQLFHFFPNKKIAIGQVWVMKDVIQPRNDIMFTRMKVEGQNDSMVFLRSDLTFKARPDAQVKYDRNVNAGYEITRSGMVRKVKMDEELIYYFEGSEEPYRSNLICNITVREL